MTGKKHEKHHGHGHEPFFGGKILTGILIVAFIALFVFVFIVPNISSEIANEKIEIAVLLPLSGPDAEYGNICKAGINLALNEALEKGKNVNLVYYDTGTDPSMALDEYFHAVENGAQVILGPFKTVETEYIAPYAEIYKTVLITPVTGTSISDYNKYVFRFVPSNYNFCNAVLTLAKNYAVTNMTVLWVENTLGKSTYDLFSEVASEEGIQITGIPLSSYDDVIAELNTSSDQLIYVIPETADQLSGLLTTIADRNLSLLSKIFIASDDAFGSSLRDNVDALATNVLVPSLSTADPFFLQKFKNEYGSDFDVMYGYALYGYDALTTLIDVMSGSEKTGPEIAEKLKNYRYLGQTGPIVFDENLDRFPTYDTYDSEWGKWGSYSLFTLLYTQIGENVDDYTDIKMRILDAYHSGNESLARQIYETEWK
ncbi:MAG TPA: ABC transporter substrate-binding protein [Methanocorpusculum sp.]|nr:ABC transporter substrate-binding protein [Methanocorpusculum sp.]